MRRLVVALSIVAACSCRIQPQTVATNTDASPPAVTASVAPRSLDPAPSPGVAPIALSPCRPRDLTGSFDQWGAAAGSYGGAFRLAPAGRDPCAVPEHPVVRFVDQRGDRLSFVDAWPDPVRWVPVRTAAGDDATFFTVLWSGHGGEPSYSCARRTTPLLAVEIDLAEGPFELDFPADARPVLCTEPAERVFVQIVAREP